MSSAKRIRRRRPAAIARTGAQILATILLLGAATLAVLSRNHPEAVKQVREVTDEILAPLLRLTAAPVGFFSDLGDDASSYFDVRERNLELESQLKEYDRLERSVERLAAENAMLRARLHVTAWPAEIVATTRVVGSGGGPFVRSVLIDAGRRAGVQPETAVVDKSGVVGRVIGSGQISARVLLLTDLNSRIPIRVQRTGDTGILVGNNRERPEIQFLPLGAEISVGDRIVTSGHGGVFPPDLPVGVVEFVNNDLVAVTPYAELGRLGFLTVLKTPDFNDDVMEGEPATALTEAEGQ